MANKARDTLVWDSCRGRNGFDPPSDLPDDMAAEAFDVVFRGGLFGKRKGSAAQTITGTFTSYASLYRFVPGQSDAAAELIFSTQDATTKIMRVAAGTAATELTLSDAVANAYRVNYATLNGKCYIAYDSTLNRLHVIDPHISPVIVRRAGLPTPGAPAAASFGSGSYGTTERDYRVQWVTYLSGTLQRASNLGTVLNFTPSASGASVTVTRPSVPSEGETHWRVWGSADGGDTYFLLSTTDIAIATTTYSDTVEPGNYDESDPAPDEGFFTPFPSTKYILSTGERLLGFGAWETTAGDSLAPRNGRVWFTPVLDSSDYDDDERVDASLGGFIDVSRDAGAEDRGLVGPLDNQIMVGQSRGIFFLLPTGNVAVPYRRVTATTILGWVSQKSAFMGEDEFGRPCIYFLDPSKGPYRYGVDGFQWLGYDVQDLWETVNLSASSVVAHGLYDPETRQVTWAIATGSSNVPNELITFDVREGQATQTEGVRYGWARWTLPDSQWVCSVMFAETFGATMSRNIKPYSGGSVLTRYEDDAALDDNGTAFQGYATSKVYLPDSLNQFKSIRQAYLQAAAAQGVQIQVSLSRDFGRETRAFVMNLSPTNNQTRVRAKYETAVTVDTIALQVTVGDAAAIANSWALDQLVMPVEFDEEDR